MDGIRTIEMERDLFGDEAEAAAEVRRRLAGARVLLVNLMASPGAGKTTLLASTIGALRDRARIGVVEADIAGTVDAEALAREGIPAVQLHTGGECAVDARMMRRALDTVELGDFDLLFLENVGNLVCPAENDVGAGLRVCVLSVPEGDDKPLKYPLMFAVADAVVISKLDVRGYFPFDLEEAGRRILRRNPKARIFPVSARTGEGMEAWLAYLEDAVEQRN